MLQFLVYHYKVVGTSFEGYHAPSYRHCLGVPGASVLYRVGLILWLRVFVRFQLLLIMFIWPFYDVSHFLTKFLRDSSRFGLI